MIAFVDGPVEEVREGSLVVRAGAFGVEAWAPHRTLARARIGERVRLHTYLVLREDGATLYGFDDAEALNLFRLLLGVGGVGPKAALAVLSHLPPDRLAAAVLEEDAGLLSGAPGVGKRTAERIILEMRTKLPDSLAAQASAGGAVESDRGRDAIDALLALGYRQAAVTAAVNELLRAEPEAGTETLVRKALTKLR